MNQKKKVEEAVADRILELLDQGNLPPWRKGWQARNGRAKNAASGNNYRGINRWLLAITQDLAGYGDPRWLSFKQAQTLGGSVSKGEKGTQVVFYKPPPEKPAKENEEETPRHGPVLRLYHVFNVEQTNGCQLDPVEPLPPPPSPIEEAEAVIAGMPDPPELTSYQWSDEPPCYVPSRDLIRMPEKSLYDRVETWYGTMFHELIHSTGHAKRLGRLQGNTAPQDIHEKGLEELVAEIGAAMLSERAGIEAATLENSAAYVKSWRDAIAGDKSIVMRAAGMAEKATAHITGGEA